MVVKISKSQENLIPGIPANEVVRKSKKTGFLLLISTAVVLAMSVFAVVSYYALANRYNSDRASAILDSMSLRSNAVSGNLQQSSCAGIADNKKFDCYPDAPVTQEQCESRGCCYQVPTNKFTYSRSMNYPPLAVPYCYYPSDYTGYSVKNVKKTSYGYEAYLKRVKPSGFPNDIQSLKISVSEIDENTVQIEIVGVKSGRIELPVQKPDKVRNVPENQKLYDILLSENGTLSVMRKSTGAAVFNTNLRNLVYSEQFLQLSSLLPTTFIYGLGEHYDNLLRSVNWTRSTMFNRDRGPVANQNLYGSHLFHVAVEEKHDSHGIFLASSHATDVILQPTPAITYRTIGGFLDFFIFFGPSPDQVVQQYTKLLGRPIMPPYWSLGFHLCKYGYGSLNETKKVWKRTRDAEIPFDTQWNDIDYMDRRNDFSYDHVAFAGLPEFVKELHDEGMHYVPMIDPGISNAEKPGTYPPYDDGVKADIFVKNSDGTIFVGKVWNDVSTVFPDFLNPAARNYWKEQFENMHKVIPFDGAWIDMNEPSNFYDGQKSGCPDSSLENPPYVPGGLEPLRTKTLCMSAMHYGQMPHYAIHNMYGILEADATYRALASITQKRPFIISRSTFSGQGLWSGHWSGDILSSWEDMRYSVVALLNFNIFGMPLMGSDICGFRGNTTIELCARWSALGAFNPFARNHNDLNQRDQDPVALGEVVVIAARNTLITRYRLLPFLYYLFYESHAYGKTVARPLFFEFTDDPVTYNIDEQFMWGSALMIMPALYPGVTEIKVYFPKAVWYDYYSGQRIKQSGEFTTLPAPMDSINLAFRGGYVIPHQHNNLTTTQSRKNKFYLLAGLDEKQSAHGELYWDDGESLDTYHRGFYNLIKFDIKNNTLSSTVMESGYKETKMDLDYVKICGLSMTPTVVSVNGKIVKPQFDKYKCLTVTVNLSLMEHFIVTWK